ncbi:MAG: CAP domain-containing protein, partial [Chloroflexi bacterium]|nr:CAP domain-containing protein [Chloroflexota bacterium]
MAPVSAQGDDAAQILGRINALRQQNGLLPLDLSSTLIASAQRHSDDMARTGNVDHTGSDGSSIDSRILAAGYGRWRDFGIWGENIYGGQLASVDVAWDFWTGSQVHRGNILKPRYREIGIGVGRSDNGTYYTLNFGAQPNVLPFFVTGSAPVVTLLLTNENDIT